MDCKVLFIIHGKSSNISGQELSLLDRIKGLRRIGVQCEVVLREPWIFADILNKEKVKVTFLKLNRLSRKNPFPFISTVFNLWKLIMKENFSIVHCSGVYPTQYSLIAARLAGIPCITHVNTTGYEKEEFQKSFVKYTDAVIGVAQTVKEKVIKATNISAHKVFNVYDGIIKNGIGDLNLINKELLKKQFNIDGDIKIVGQMGQIMPRKGLEYFIQMSKMVKEGYPRVKFLIIGDTNDTDENREYERMLRKLIENLSLRDDIIFLGFQENYYDFLNIFDVSVLASLAEGLPRVVVESMALGKPVVCTKVSGTPEVVIDHQTGILVPPKDQEALAKAILSLLNDPVTAKELGDNGRKFVMDKFTIDNHAESLLSIYESLFKGVNHNKLNHLCLTTKN